MRGGVFAVLAACALFEAGLGARLLAQEMPDPSLIHGRAIPAPELPTGTVTVRVVREAIGNDISGQEVQLSAGGSVRRAKTDAEGRAAFRGLPAGADAVAEATVDGERLVSQPFAVPAGGGLRVILVAGLEQAAERRRQEEERAAAAAPTPGAVVIGGASRIHIEFNDDALRVFYLLEIVNNARTRVDIGGPLVIDMPRAAQGATLLQGSSDSASVSGRRLTVVGPFAPGTTTVQVGYSLPFDDPRFTLDQPWPVPLQQVTVVVEQTGGITLTSPQVAGVREVRSGDGKVFLLGSGPALQPGVPLSLTLSNLPTRSPTPRYVALALALGIIALGAWLAAAGTGSRRPSRSSLLARRDQLLGQLAQIELKLRAGGGSADRLAARKRRMMAELEEIYGALDDAQIGPRDGGEGLAA